MQQQLIPWTIEIKQLMTRLRGAPSLPDRPVCIDVTIRAMTPACPREIEDCMNYQPVCEWIVEDLPRQRYRPRLETALRAVLAVVVDSDPRIEWAEVNMTVAGTTLTLARSRQQHEDDAARWDGA
ncbi:MAG: hypothetical protein V4724_13065 [Pseudomonadota bacterium]